jgi:RNA polymerase sigma-70 factor (ECF subfamily)
MRMELVGREAASWASIPGRAWPAGRVKRLWPAIAGAHAAQGTGALDGAADSHPGRASTALVAYEPFVRQHERAILNYLWRMTGDEELAYDLTQEVFLRAWQRWETIRGYEQPRAWLFRVATNLARSHLRRRSPLGQRVPMPDDDAGPATSDPAWRLAEADQVRDALLQLSPKRRAALVLREVYQFSAAEIGAMLGMREAAVRMTVHRAREQFRALYPWEGQHDA